MGNIKGRIDQHLQQSLCGLQACILPARSPSGYCECQLGKYGNVSVQSKSAETDGSCLAHRWRSEQSKSLSSEGERKAFAISNNI